MVNLLEEPYAGAQNTMHPLARVWRLLISQTDVNGTMWLTKLNTWQNRLAPLIGIPKSISLKSNTTRILASDKISWGSIMKGFAILGYTRIRITFECYKDNPHHKGDVVVIDVTQVMPSAAELEKDLLELEKENRD